MRLDDTNRILLDELQRNCNTPIRELSKKVGLSKTAVHHRIKKLEKEGIIEGYQAIVDAEKCDIWTTALVFVTVKDVVLENDKKLQEKEIMKEIAKIPEVSELYGVTGEWDIVLKVRGPGTKATGQLITEKIRSQPGVEKTVTSIAIYTLKESSPLPLIERSEDYYGWK